MDQIVKQDSFTHLIAGASKGIGRALLNSCVDKGEQVIALSRSQPDPLPSGCQWLTADARQPESFADELPEVIHRLTFCPGKVILGPLKRISPEQVMEAYRTNVVDAFGLIQALLPKLTDSSIVLISSVAAGTGLPNHCAISAAKAGLEGLALALAADLAPKTRVNVVAPTLTPTEMGLAMVGEKDDSDDRKPASPQKATFRKEIADTISFLHSSSAASITGQVFKVDGGLPIFELHDFQFSKGLTNKTIVWFRKDLRLRDNPTLEFALANKEIPVFVWDDEGGRGVGLGFHCGFIKLSKAWKARLKNTEAGFFSQKENPRRFFLKSQRKTVQAKSSIPEPTIRVDSPRRKPWKKPSMRSAYEAKVSMPPS